MLISLLSFALCLVSLVEGQEQLPTPARVVQGETADEGEYPWHVGLVKEESKKGFLSWVRHLGGLIRTTTYCGGTLVSDRWLVTAAHCIHEGDRPVDMRVVMGRSKRDRFFYYFFQTDSIDQIHVHPRYDPNTHAYDIALLRLKKLPHLKRGELWPACLPSVSSASYAGQTATVIGWGKTVSQGQSSASKYFQAWRQYLTAKIKKRPLQELSVNVISDRECQNYWSWGRGRVEIGGAKMCFRSGGAPCHGDSGGGMFILDDRGKQSLIGVCSYGTADCKNWAPEVYAKVNFVLDWIKDTLGKQDINQINQYNCG